MSAGIRSGVNWMRLNDRCRILDTVLTSSVLARPGTPTRRQWPRLNRAMSSCSDDLGLADDDLADLFFHLAIGLTEFAHDRGLVGG